MAEKKRKKRYEEEEYEYEDVAEVDESSLGSTIKGMIAVMITLLVVVIIIMVFAKSLFIQSNTTPVKTGVVTSTEYIAPVTTTTAEEVTQATTTTKATTSEDSSTSEEDEETAVDIQCISAVYLHPQPTSSSETLLTIPKGATCKYYRNESGWYYVEYNGTKGYAWKTFFETPQTDE
jgi:cytoskeletal protein RodZ